MSFSGKTKVELARHIVKARHCQLAELSAITEMCGELRQQREKGEYLLKIHTENISVARKVFTLLKKAFNIDKEIYIWISVRRNTPRNSYSYLIQAQGRGLQAVKNASVQAECCKRAYIRGAFLAAGSMSDPGKSYHFEIVCDREDTAQLLCSLMQAFKVRAKIVQRKRNYVVYLKEGDQIVDVLNVMEAHSALMEMENVRILKEMRNTVNRKVNCETANINKTVSAAVNQIEDITYIRNTIGLKKLPSGLRDVALTRLAYPEATLKELGALMDPPIGKSGVNHRLRKISEIAEKLRGK